MDRLRRLSAAGQRRRAQCGGARGPRVSRYLLLSSVQRWQRPGRQACARLRAHPRRTLAAHGGAGVSAGATRQRLGGRVQHAGGGRVGGLPDVSVNDMDTTSFGPVLLTLFNELIDGSPDPSRRTYMLNQGDAGFLVSLDRLPAAAASAANRGPSIAAHVDHVRYGLSLLNRWA